MIFIITLFACRLIAESDPATQVVEGHDCEDTADTETASVDSGDSAEPIECGFTSFDLLTHGDVETTSLAMFSSSLGGTAIEVSQGDTVHYPFTVGASDCGNVAFNMANLNVFDMARGAWLQELSDAGVPMGLTNFTDSVVYDPVPTYPLGDDDIGLDYTWYDGVTGSAINGAFENMPTVDVPAGTDTAFEFTFTTEYIPVGTNITVRLLLPMWTDVPTGTTVWDITNAQDTVVTITIVE